MRWQRSWGSRPRWWRRAHSTSERRRADLPVRLSQQYYGKFYLSAHVRVTVHNSNVVKWTGLYCTSILFRKNYVRVCIFACETLTSKNPRCSKLTAGCCCDALALTSCGLRVEEAAVAAAAEASWCTTCARGGERRRDSAGGEWPADGRGAIARGHLRANQMRARYTSTNAATVYTMLIASSTACMTKHWREMQYNYWNWWAFRDLKWSIVGL